MTVKTGLFGTKETFVPLALARPRGPREVELAADKDTITGAPKIDPDGELAESEEAELYRHYGLPYGEQRSPTGLPETGVQETGVQETGGLETGGPETGGLETGRPMAGQGDDAMTRSEERMRVGTATEQTGRARLRKYVVTEQVQQTVPVSREEVRIEREPVTEANRDAAMAGPEITEAEHEVTLHKERPVVEKETVPVERVRLTKESIPGEETISGEVRKEHIETEGDIDPAQ